VRDPPKIFGDIYEWAGQIRTVAIAKGSLFCLPITSKPHQPTSSVRCAARTPCRAWNVARSSTGWPTTRARSTRFIRSVRQRADPAGLLRAETSPWLATRAALAGLPHVDDTGRPYVHHRARQLSGL